MAKPRVLILCSANSARSQMAEGMLRALWGDAGEVFSAGTHPTIVNPLAVEAMREIGIDISAQRSKAVEEFAGQNFDVVIAVCHRAAAECPAFPGTAEMIRWDFEDPAAAPGSHAERLGVFRRVRDGLKQKLAELVREHPAWQARNTPLRKS